MNKVIDKISLKSKNLVKREAMKENVPMKIREKIERIAKENTSLFPPFFEIKKFCIGHTIPLPIPKIIDESRNEG